MCFSRMVAACHTHSCIECCLADQISLTSMLYRVAAAICARAPATMSVSAAFESCPNLACGRLVESRCIRCYSSRSLFVTLLLQLLLRRLLTFQVPQQCLRYILHIRSNHGGMQLLTKGIRNPGSILFHTLPTSSDNSSLGTSGASSSWLSFGAIMCNVSFARNPRYVVQALQPQAAHGSHAL